jgi:hypothetical protein
VFTAPTTGSNPSYPANFPANTGDGGLCSSSQAVGEGASCDVSANFQPTGVGANSGNIVFTDNALPATQTIASSGTGLQAAASLTTPAPGSTLTGSSVAFAWTAGGGVTGYQLWISAVGAGKSELYNSGVTTALTATVNGLPTGGVTLYARLYSLIGTTWSYNDYTYTEAGTPVLAAMASPAPGSSLTSSSATFAWSAGAGPSEYQLWVGSTGLGSSNLYNSGAVTVLTETVTGLPVNAEKLYVRLYSRINTAWQYVDYTYYAVGTPAKLTSPTAKTVLASTTQAFTWSAGAGVTAYQLWIGTSEGENNIYNSGVTSLLTETVTGLPSNAEKLWVRVYSRINGAYQYNDYFFYATGTPSKAAITSPTGGTTFTGSSATFNWSTGAGVSYYQLWISAKGPGKNELYNSGSVTTLSATVNNLPTNGATLYVRLYSLVQGVYQLTDYTYTESGTPTLAAMTSPTPGSTLASSSQTFTWSAGAGPIEYQLWVSAVGPGKNELYNSGATTALTKTVTGLPTTGGKLYVRLYSKVGATWLDVDYTYTAQ